ncbi:MAG: hypothetical protein KBF89_05090 [Acidimicrobiia bacterium]|nr:hypothetical protein [Acidimicrobiia bacterium]
MHSTNYFDTFIEVAQDCPAEIGQEPPVKDPKTVAQITYEMLIDNDYKYTSDDVLYNVGGKRKGISRKDFFSKGQACFRASPLTKRYGWGVHSDSEGKIAIYPVESKEYKKLAGDENLTHLRAMRSNSV